ARIRLPVTVRVATIAGGGRSFVCRTRDVSDQGMLLETPEVLDTGLPVVLTILDEQTGFALELTGLVARSEPAAEVGPSTSGGTPAASSTPGASLGARAHADRPGRSPNERPARRLRVLVVADEVARRGAVALYVTSGWDVRFASDLASTEEALRGIRIDAVIA